MPAALDVDREAIKTLAVAVGVREAARQTGLSEDRVRKWSSRGNWFKPTPQPPSQGQVTTVTNPSDALQNTLLERKNNTRLHLSKYVQEAAEVASNSSGSHKLSRSTKDVADIMSKLWPESTSTGAGGIHIGLLTGQVAIQYTQPDPTISGQG